jgi:uncharacterized protein (TIGR00297 family)
LKIQKPEPKKLQHRNRRNLDRLTTYIFGLIVIILFILEGKAHDHVMILTGLGLAIPAAYLAFIAGWITLDATKSAIMLGTIALGFGGWWLALALIFFFVTSSYLSTSKKRNITNSGEGEEAWYKSSDERRDSFQVWSNGFWLAVFTILWFMSGLPALLVAAFAVVAVATSDTWATELGSLKPGKTRRITNFKRVEPGTDGGVSLKGTMAAIAGSFMIALFLLPVDLYSPELLILVFAAGFIGSLADSYAGAYLQSSNVAAVRPYGFTKTSQAFKNNFVNWLSTGIGGLLAFMIANFFIL